MRKLALRMIAAFTVAIVSSLAAFQPSAPTSNTSGIGTPDLLLFGGLSLLSNVMNKKGETTISPGKHVIDVLIDVGTNEEDLRYWFTIDSTVGGQMAFGDRIALRVKSFKNGPPPRDLTLYINDAKADRRKVEGDRGDGVIGGYPLVYVKDLEFGANQLKTRFSNREWTTSVVNRIDLVQYNALRSENNLLEVAHAGHLGYPYTPVYTLPMPNGQIRAFESEAEAAAAIEQINQDMANGKNRVQPIQRPAENQGSSQSRQVEPWPITVYGVGYNLDQAKAAKFDVKSALRTEALKRDPLDASRPLTINGGLLLVLRGDQPFEVSLVDPSGKSLARLKSVRSGDADEIVCPLALRPGDTLNNLVIDGRWVITFSRGEKS